MSHSDEFGAETKYKGKHTSAIKFPGSFVGLRVTFGGKERKRAE
jgi:hypothetical protein